MIPRNAKLEKALVTDQRAAWQAYGRWLAKEGHPLAAVIEADLAVNLRALSSASKKHAREVFHAYVAEHLAPGYPTIAQNFVHFTEKVFTKGAGFRYGVLDELDTFMWTKAMCAEGAQLLRDEHARFARKLCPRDIAFASLDAFADKPLLRKLEFRWSNIAKVTSLEPLAGSRTLVALDVRSSKITDLAPLKKVPIVQLYVDGTALKSFAGLVNHRTLEDLYAKKTRAKDIAPLLTCKRLCHVDLWDSAVTAKDAQRLVDKIQSRNPKASNPPDTISGYSPGLSHHDVMWV
ncbi:MAG TPA: hypothetical protein VGC41_17715 [Kofleriaceae bacterium]